MAERLITPSKITAWLECSHFLTLRNAADAGDLQLAPRPKGSLADLLVEKGAQHERDCLAEFLNDGRSVWQVPGRNPDETFAQWVARIGNPFDGDVDVIYQMPLLHDGMRGIADFLVRVVDENGAVTYEPIDAKLTRTQAKPGHVLQLCFYADAIEALSGRTPKEIHLWLGSGAIESLSVEQFRPYWRRLRSQLVAHLEDEANERDTAPVPCDHCDYCEFSPVCDERWRREDSLVYVANIRPPDRAALEHDGVRTIVDLARRVEPVEHVHDETLVRLQRQASLQVASRDQPELAPAYELVAAGDDPIFGHGFELLPEPDAGDVFFDFEGHPFWTPQHDLFFLSGLLYVVDGRWTYDARWAHDLGDQANMVRELVEFFAKRRESFPRMHVYHYNHTERSSLERLTRGTESEGLFTSLVQSGLFVDLYVVAKNAVQVGTESYGLKHLERLSGFERHGGIEQGAGAVVEYEQYMHTGEQRLLDEIARYNEDDVEATRALRDWLVVQRPSTLEWRDATFEVDDVELDTDALVQRLHELDDPVGNLLADLLNYWRRERTASTEPKFAQAASDFATLYPDPDFIANLQFVDFEAAISRGAEVRDAIFTWPTQSVGAAFADKKKRNVLMTGAGVERGYGYVPRVDLEHRTLRLRWKDHYDEAAMPTVMAVDDYVWPGEKPAELVHLATQVLDPRPDDPIRSVAYALLAGSPPSFRSDGGLRSGVFDDDLDSMLSWVGDLDGSYVAVQGPPGTGKTYSGSHIIHHLVVECGLRVGMTAMSHAAIDNLLEATYDVFAVKGDLERLVGLRRAPKPDTGALDGVTYSNSNAVVESERFNVVAATTWLWARPAMRPYPVDVLVIDEAGQLALADAVACTNAAHNLILLGDPLQLSQVSQAEHPDGSGASVLEHILGEHATIPRDRGVFITQSRRMHPDVCRFISDQIYEGRLTSHASCATQSTQFGTGLRWIAAKHTERSTESVEEAVLVEEQIATMIGTPWTNQDGVTQVLRDADFMVVAPYNDQVRLLARRFAANPRLRNVQVGTVDKFQGREAPVVFFTMTTSSGADMPRGPEFLFSRNRLNVAVSRARCLAYLVCTESLLNARAKTIDEMRLIGTLSSFVEYATAS